MPYVEKSKRQKVLDAWFAKLPEHIAKVVSEQFPGMADCYKLKNTGDSMHCAMWGIDSFVIEDLEIGIPITCSILLAADAVLPGLTVVHIPLTQLAICECGKWEMPEVVIPFPARWEPISEAN